MNFLIEPKEIPFKNKILKYLFFNTFIQDIYFKPEPGSNILGIIDIRLAKFDINSRNLSPVQNAKSSTALLFQDSTHIKSL